MNLTSESVVVITGASAGIGKALAQCLATTGARLALLARRGDVLETLATELADTPAEVLPIQCDVTDRDAFASAIEQVIERFGRIDVLVNNAGSGHFAYIDETPTEHIENIFAVNVFSLWYGTAVALQYMRPHGRGHIINIASIAGKIGYPGNAAYVAAKHAVVGFTRALRAELAGTGVQASVVIPAGVYTDWGVNTEGGPMLELFEYEGRRGRELALEAGTSTPPALPLLQSEEIAQAIAALIATPQPELYTHPGSLELVREYETEQQKMELKLEPFWLANRQGYEKLQKGEPLKPENEE